MKHEPAWTPGPLAAFGEHRAEHGKFVYAVRETEPKGQIAGYPTPTARYRNRADAQIGALAPSMAEAILEMRAYPTLNPEDVFEDVLKKLDKIGVTDEA